MTDSTAVAGAAVAATDLVKTYGGLRALDGIDLTVPEGTFYLLAGPNGAGKTTFLKILLDLIRQDSGRVSVLGGDPVAEGPSLRARMGWVPERHDLLPSWMTGRRILDFMSSYYTAWDHGYEAELTGVLELVLDRQFSTLSKGQARRIQLVTALAHRPKLLLLDEPTDGLDPVMRDRVKRTLTDHLARFPATVIVSTHLIHEVEGMADHVAVLRAGAIRWQSSRDVLQETLRRYRLRAPRGWRPPDSLDVVSGSGQGREGAWVVRGLPDEVRASIAAAGAEVVDVEGLSLEQATMALLGGDL